MSLMEANSSGKCFVLFVIYGKIKSEDRPITTPTFVMLLYFATHSLALTSIPFRDFPLLYEFRGGSLYISLSRRGFFILNSIGPLIFSLS